MNSNSNSYNIVDGFKLLIQSFIRLLQEPGIVFSQIKMINIANVIDNTRADGLQGIDASRSSQYLINAIAFSSCTSIIVSILSAIYNLVMVSFNPLYSTSVLASTLVGIVVNLAIGSLIVMIICKFPKWSTTAYIIIAILALIGTVLSGIILVGSIFTSLISLFFTNIFNIIINWLSLAFNFMSILIWLGAISTLRKCQDIYGQQNFDNWGQQNQNGWGQQNQNGWGQQASGNWNQQNQNNWEQQGQDDWWQ